ncbi:hypothetical protein NJT12_03340 [Flavobacterium sp. AC]|uniref:Uncharacterized protein n=1 Tax=Flavobacterium azizsancarii TaxID=2961580 RepID=A0ABT4W7V8_9FLAO|nr:hypothetical protein [Flavobacterium azizsancarii]MDA6068645.1 hypothetical protein [Flavobacterium azizsancarii]
MPKKNIQTNASHIDEAFLEKVENHFIENPKKKKIHLTSDGFLFDVKKFASNHGETLEDKEVKTVKNSNLIEVDLDEDSDEDPASPSGVAATQNIKK